MRPEKDHTQWLNMSMLMKMHSIPPSISHYYSRKIREFGLTPQGVDWKDVDAQRSRFRAFSSTLDKQSPMSINDLGCGYGALLHYLWEEHCQLVHYHGYDVSEKMIEAAQAHCASIPNGTFTHGDAYSLQPAEYTYASGIFNVKLDAKNEDWEEYCFFTIDQMARVSEKGFAFNALSHSADWQDPKLFYMDSVSVIERCKNIYSPYVTLISDYHLFDFTVVVTL